MKIIKTFGLTLLAPTLNVVVIIRRTLKKTNLSLHEPTVYIYIVQIKPNTLAILYNLRKTKVAIKRG